MIKVWKVLARIEGKLYSAILEKNGQEYSEEETNYPLFEKSKIFAFDSEGYANSFRVRNEDFIHLEVWLAETSVITYTPRIAALLEKEYLRSFWEKGLSYWNTKTPPEGTVLCDDLKLISRCS